MEIIEMVWKKFCFLGMLVVFFPAVMVGAILLLAAVSYEVGRAVADKFVYWL